jgi:spore germination protein KC
VGTRHRTVRLLCTLLIFPLLAGCWDRIEIEERAVILGIAVDLSKEGDEEDEVPHYKDRAFVPPSGKMIKVTVQVAVPGRIPLGPGEGGQGGGGGTQGQTVWALEVTGHTMEDALANLQQQISAPLFFGHLRIIVVSEAYARNGLGTVTDFLRRNSEIRRTSYLVVSKGNAAELMRAAPQLERVPTLYLQSTLEHAVKMGKFPRNEIGRFWSNSSKKGQEGFLAYLEVKKMTM